MSLLCQFLQESFESSISSIIDDNALTPSDQFREYIQLKRLTCPVPASFQRDLRYHTVSSVEAENASRSVNRRHSEPLQASASTTASPGTGSSSVVLAGRAGFSVAVDRWGAAIRDDPESSRDVMLRIPARFVDKRGLTRNQSDSALLVREKEWSMASVPPLSVPGSPRQELSSKDIIKSEDEASYIVQHAEESSGMALVDGPVNIGRNLALGPQCLTAIVDLRDEARTYKKELVRAPSSTTASSTPMVHFYSDYPCNGSMVPVQSIAEQNAEAVVPAFLSPLALLMT